MLTCTFEDGGSSSFRHVVTDAIVERDGKILLARRAVRLTEGGKLALPGGFLNRDETASVGMLRELKEETGWDGVIQSVFQINTNPKRRNEDRQNVAIIFLITATEEVGIPDDEVTEVLWVPITELPPLESLAFDHGETLAKYIEYRTTPFPLPLFI